MNNSSVNLGFVYLTCVVFVCFVRKGVQLQESERYVMRARGTTLTVRNIQQDDGGSYTCRASNKAGEVEHELFLKVFGKSFFFLFGYASLHPLSRMLPVKLTCLLFCHVSVQILGHT